MSPSVTVCLEYTKCGRTWTRDLNEVPAPDSEQAAVNRLWSLHGNGHTFVDVSVSGVVHITHNTFDKDADIDVFIAKVEAITAGRMPVLEAHTV